MSYEDRKVFIFCWKIYNFSSCSLETGEKLRSPEFKVEGLNNTKLYLALYPKGANKLCADNISCFLLRSEDSDAIITISYKLEAIFNGRILQTFERSNGQVVKNCGVSGSFTFLKRKLLSDFEISDNDILTIRCHLSRYDFQEQIVKCEARSEIQMEKFAFKWKVQIPDVPEYSKKISASYHDSTEFNVILTTSDEKMNFKVQVAAVLTKLYKIELSVFDDKSCKLELQNGTHLFTPESDSLEFSAVMDKTQILMDSMGTISCFSILVKCDISSPTGSISSAIENYYFENVLDGPLLSKVRQSFQDNLLDMLLKEKHCDVKLRAGDKIIPAHKSMLSVRSPVFSAMFDQDMAENRTGIVEIQEIESDVLQSFLEFLYTDSLTKTDCEHILKLLLVADRYQVQSLKERCSPILMSKISVENATEVIYVADLINHQSLKMFTLDFIRANKHKILFSNDWSEWMEKNTKLAIQILSKLAVN